MTTFLDVQRPKTGRKIAIVIPTLDVARAEKVGLMALATCACSVPTFVVVQHDTHRQGFTRTVNDGIRRVPVGCDVCILNDDITQFQYGWLEIMRRILYSRKDFGLVGPSGASGAAPMNTGRPGLSGHEVVSQISFWCVLLKREVLDALGLLDEVFIHYCSDNWYCRQMTMAGWRCVWARSVFLVHQKHSSGIQHEWKKHDRKIYFDRIR